MNIEQASCECHIQVLVCLDKRTGRLQSRRFYLYTTRLVLRAVKARDCGRLRNDWSLVFVLVFVEKISATRVLLWNFTYVTNLLDFFPLIEGNI